MNRIVTVMLAWSLMTPARSAGPTTDNALAAEQELTQALLANDADAVGRLLADDWVVVPVEGGDLSNRTAFLAAIKSGDVVRKTLVLSAPRVRLYDKVAVITSQVTTSGTSVGTAFDVKECQTDVLVWDGNGWKSVFVHETKIRPPSK